jgi:hypothetical protein
VLLLLGHVAVHLVRAEMPDRKLDPGDKGQIMTLLRALWYGAVAAFFGVALGTCLPIILDLISNGVDSWKGGAGLRAALHVALNQPPPSYLLPGATIFGICTGIAAGVGGVVHGTLYEERKSKNSKGDTGVGVAAALALLTGAIGGAVFGLGCPQIREEVRTSAALFFAVVFAVFSAFLAGAVVQGTTSLEEGAAKARQRRG